jgi:hypothetical protein
MADADAAAKLVIVVGAHPRAELMDRAPAYWLASRLAEVWRTETGKDAEPGEILVCADLWYVNDRELVALPTIAVGAPDRNAFAAYLADKLPSVHVVDDVLMVQAEISFEAALACCWGVDAQATRRAVEVLLSKFGDTLVGAAAGLDQDQE